MSRSRHAEHTKADLRALSDWRLARLRKAANAVLHYTEIMGRSGTNPVAQALRGSANFLQDEHYPPGDVYDETTGGQFYYHAHRSPAAENGHFHVFVRHQGMPAGMQLAMPSSKVERPTGSEAIAHLVAISMDRGGLPAKLFVTNQWVTGETFYRATDTIRLLDRFRVEHTDPCLATNRWMTAIIQLFRPQIRDLLVRRDLELEKWLARHPRRDPLDAAELEIIAEMPIDIDAQVGDVDRETQRRRRLQRSRTREGGSPA